MSPVALILVGMVVGLSLSIALHWLCDDEPPVRRIPTRRRQWLQRR